MIKKLKKFTLQMIAGANIVTILIMMVVGYSDRISPTFLPSLSNVGLFLPVFILLNFAFLVFWLVFKARWALIPIVGFLLCYGPIRTYCPINLKKDIPADAIKVMSYNVWLFAGWEYRNEPNPIYQYIIDTDADIVCMQEAGTQEVKKQGELKAILKDMYPYRETSSLAKNGDVLACYSKFPILRKEDIEYESKNNHSTVFYLDMNGDTVIVINNHFQSIGLTPKEKDEFKKIVKGDMKRDEAEKGSKKLIGRLNDVSKIRAPQADAVGRFIDQHRDKSIILCGDFNDGPNSYTHHALAKRLTDCYVESGNGLGISYNQNGFYIRIDNIMCSKDWTPLKCVVDKKIDASDHYPVVCWLKKNPKP